ncbi:MAG: hypothetical protein LQ345_003372 [Seirophora villosa]|nr:MAG: hypothetical protein LQ345_003372 [Seirophora villosa]
MADKQLQSELMKAADEGYKKMFHPSSPLAAAAKVNSLRSHGAGSDGSTELGINGDAGVNLVPSYDSSAELVAPRSQMLTRAAAARADNTHSVASRNGANRKLDGRTAASPYDLGSSEVFGESPSPQQSPFDSADSSADNYEEKSDEHSDEDSDDEYSITDTRPSRARNVHTKATSSQPIKRNPNAPALSKLQRKRLDYSEKGIQLDSNGTKRGVTRGDSDNLEYLDRGLWVPAVYHHKIRGTLLETTDNLGKYDEEPASGIDPLDRTAFKVDHKSVKFITRELRPGVLLQWNQIEEPQSTLPDRWYHQQRLVLDVDNRPMLKWHELPLTISGQCEGLRMEFYKRLNPAISMNDLKARMPPTTCRRGGLKALGVKTPALANRMTRDRCRTGLKAWQARQGSRYIETRILQLMPEDIQRTILRTNNTSCFRDLTTQELDFVEAANRGTVENLAKAGTRLLDDETRRERAERKSQRTMGRKGPGVKLHEVIPEALEERPPLVPRSEGRKRSLSSMPDTSTKRQRHSLLPSTDDTYGGQEEEEHSNALAASVPHHHHYQSHNNNNNNNNNNTNEAFPKTISPFLPAAADFRYKRPITSLDAAIVQMALNLSRDDYERYVGLEAPATERTASYESQLAELNIAFGLQMGGGMIRMPELKAWGPVKSFDELHALALARARKQPGLVVADPGSATTGQRYAGGWEMGMDGDTLV